MHLAQGNDVVHTYRASRGTGFRAASGPANSHTKTLWRLYRNEILVRVSLGQHELGAGICNNGGNLTSVCPLKSVMLCWSPKPGHFY